MTLAIREDGNGDIVLHQRAATPAQDYTSNAITRLTDWAQEARAAASIAASLVKTSFVPEAFRGKAEEATAAILTGFEMGLSPMAALRAIYVIKGTPGMYAKTMRAIVQSKGHDIWVDSANSTRVVVKGRRKGSEKVETSIWDMERVKKAQLANNAQYAKNPQNMLTARATAEVCWLIASDALHGISASVEELGEDPDGQYGGDDSAPTDAAEPAKRTAKRKPVERAVGAEPDAEPVRPASAPAVVDDPEPVVDDSSSPDDQPMSESRSRAMFATFREAAQFEPSLDTKEGQLDYIAETIGHRIESRKELTASEGELIVDSLKRYIAQCQPTDAEVADVVGDQR